jgi:hypothetical protein
MGTSIFFLLLIIFVFVLFVRYYSEFCHLSKNCFSNVFHELHLVRCINTIVQ